MRLPGLRFRHFPPLLSPQLDGSILSVRAGSSKEKTPEGACGGLPGSGPGHREMSRKVLLAETEGFEPSIQVLAQMLP